MSDAKPTPGPWHLGGSLVTGADGHSPIAVVLHKSDTMAVKMGRGARDEDYYAPPFDVYEANGKLIASAPTLAARVAELEGALRVFLAHAQRVRDEAAEGTCIPATWFGDRIDEARAALARGAK